MPQKTTEDYNSGYTEIILTADEKKHYERMCLKRLKNAGYTRAVNSDDLAKIFYEARERKYYEIKLAKYWTNIAEYGTTIPVLTAGQMAIKVLTEFKDKYGYEFDLNETNEMQFRLLCQYFTGSLVFENAKERGELLGYSLKKGILLMGPKGIGKTSLMRMFRTNQHASFTVKSAVRIAHDYTETPSNEKGSYLEYYYKTIPCAINSNIFRQTQLGICFDDIGREDEKNKYGNIVNVVAYLIGIRYENEIPFRYTHLTTNISTEKIEELYGARTRDILRESFNLITFSPKLKSNR